MATQELNGTLPQYVEYGGRATAPGEFLCTDGHFRGFLLEGDKRLIRERIDRMFNDTRSDGIQFRVLTKYTLMLIGWFGAVRATTPPFDEWGTVHEAQASIWVPVAKGRENEDGEFEADRLMMAVPFIFVDNAMSYAGGRETYGYPKSLGNFEFPKDDDGKDTVDGAMCVDTYGGPFGRDHEAGWNRILTITCERGGREADGGDHLEGETAFIDHLTDHQLDDHGEGLWVDLVGGIRVIRKAIEDARAGKSHQLFLKQFRDAHEPDRACYQAQIEAPITLGQTKADFTPGVWHIEIDETIDSHPIGRELGVKSQTTYASYATTMDFTCGRGGPVT